MSEANETNDVKENAVAAEVEKGPKFSQIQIAGAAVALATMAFGGYWAYGASVAEDEVRKALTENGLVDVIDYRDVAFNPLTREVTLSKVSVTAPNDPIWRQFLPDQFYKGEIEIERAIIRDINDTPEDLVVDLKLEGIPVDFVSLYQNRLFRDTTKGAMNLGYQQTLVDLDVQIDHDREMDTSKAHMGVNGEQLGQLVVDLDVNNVTSIDLSSGFLMMMLGRFNSRGTSLPEMLGGLEINSATVTYDDDGLGNRYTKLLKRSLIQTPADTEETVSVEPLFDHVPGMLTEAGMATEEAQDYSQTLVEFVEDPEHLSISIQPDDSIRVAKVMEQMSRSRKPLSYVERFNLEIDS